MSPLRDKYGEMIIKKGTVLYHTSDNQFTINNSKPMLFLTFHPSEYIRGSDSFITRIALNKDFSLFFMIDRITSSI